VTLQIGKRIKRLRLAKNLTQEELANRTGSTKGYISQLEREYTSPSLARLKDILDVLGGGLADFVQEHVPEQVVYQKSERILAADSKENLRVELPIQASQQQQMEPVLVTLAPEGRTWEDRSHQGQEFGYVLRGAVVLQVGHERHRLRQGDCFYFTADKRHLLENTGRREAQIMWLVTPPTF
jgi:transcriptional regulator with XRE-family HTH domain